MKFEIYESDSAFGSERWRWHLIAANNRIVAASSEGFARKEEAEENARLTYEMLGKLLPVGERVRCWWKFWN